MKEHPYKKTFKRSIKNVFITESNVEKAFQLFCEEYQLLNQCLAPAFPFKLKLIKTQSLKYRVFYEGSIDKSELSIMITHKGFEAYLWSDEGGWCLNDFDNNVEDIVEQLTLAPVINLVPENVKDLRKLLEEEYWSWNSGLLPGFNGKCPKDKDEVVSWDEDFILVGTKIENLEVIKRDDRAKLCEREKSWFKQ